MCRSVAVIVGLLIGAGLAAPAGAKDEAWAQICGRNGCKIVKDRLVTAALTSEAEEQGRKVRSSQSGPAYTVRYVARDSSEPFGPTHWLPTDAINFAIRSSQASVGRLFVRAKAGIQPFPAASAGHAGSWELVLLMGVAAGAIVPTLFWWRRKARARAALL
jgi:hypothetical protein